MDQTVAEVAEVVRHLEQAETLLKGTAEPIQEQVVSAVQQVYLVLLLHPTVHTMVAQEAQLKL